MAASAKMSLLVAVAMCVAAPIVIMAIEGCGDLRRNANTQAGLWAGRVGGEQPAARIVAAKEGSLGYVRGDDDEDGDKYSNNDDGQMRNYGHAADAGERHLVTVVVAKYFAAAYYYDGSGACKLLDSRLANTSLTKMVPTEYASGRDEADAQAKTCVPFMVDLFRRVHGQLALADAARVIVTAVRIKGARGLALLGFKTAPERWIPLRREHHLWKIDALLDLEMT